MKKVIRVLVVILILLALAVAGAMGFLWYRDNHIFVDDAVYPIDSTSLDLRGQEISVEHYESVRTQLPDCEILWDVPFQGEKYPNDTTGLAIKTLSDEDIARMDYFESLKNVDAVDCREYAQIEKFMAYRPDCKVTYAVDLGGEAFAPDSAELELSVGDYDFDTLMENLQYLRSVTAVKLRVPELTQEQLDQLKAAYETITFTCTVELAGEEYDVDTTHLDLSFVAPEAVAEIAEKLTQLPNLQTVELMADDGTSQLSKTDVKTLMEAAPGVVFNYYFDFYGYTLSTADEDIHIKNTKIGEDGVAEVREALDILTNCKRLVLEYCQISDETMAQLREDYRGRTKIVWRVFYGDGGTCLTDAQIVKAVYDLVDNNCHDLVYCEDTVFMDIGHNEWLDAVDFVAGMPKLRGIIVSGSPIKDLTPFENCKELEFLEMAFCEYVEDLTPLSKCENLKMLNMSNTHALDLSPLDDLPLTHLVARTNPSGRSRISLDEQARFQEQHPDCWASFTGAQPYGVGWRYDTDELTPLPYYALLRQVFRYDAAVIPNNVGWYLDEPTLALMASMDAQQEEAAPEETTPEETTPEETTPEETTSQE